ncbi:MAG: hypothetical protein DRO11_08140 [Methanobacteriota archaeon]|nr:MAG: hypothetical protein DRO11_08140 [Euryarchaeota archaeon]
MFRVEAPKEILTIRERRRKLGITQSKLAKYSGVSQSLIAKIEAGKVDPSYSKAVKILQALDELESRNTPKAEEIMTSRVISVSAGETIKKTIHLMEKYNISQLPVMRGNHPIGMITEKNILSHILGGHNPRKLAETSVEKVMDEAPPQVPDTTPLDTITKILHDYPAVLITRKEKIIGIITKADLLKLLRY